jgi:uncharacterized repeat protein (TIGR01451 family)
VEITQTGSGQVLFTFYNVGSIPMKISSVYFDDMNGVLQGPMTIIQAGPPTVELAQDVPAANPPRGANLIPPFVSEFSASRVNGQQYAVDPGETVGIRLAIASGKTFSNVLNDLGSGALRIAEHVINFAATNGSSEAFVNSLKSTDLSITKTDSPDPVQEGASLTYSITVTNNGPDAADNVVVTDTLPGSVSFVSATPSQGTCSGTSTVTCNFGSLSDGASATVTIMVTPNSTGEISNTTTVSSATNDPVPGNNSSTASTTVIAATPASADLSVTKSDNPDPVDVGLNVTYTVVVTDNGPDTATNVTLTDTLPASVNFVSATPTQGTCGAPSGGVITCSLGTLVNGASATVTVVVTTTTAGVIANTASVSADQTDPNLANNSVTETTNVGDVSRLVNISTRAQVQTGDNVMIGGFFVGGNLSKQLLIRARGPSLGQAPFFNAGVLNNPTMQLFSGSTVIAQNDDWVTFDSTCVSPCVANVQVTNTSVPNFTPCEPNPGQTTQPLGCNQESALLVTVPPGGYTAIVRGLGGTSGVGLVEVFDLDTGTLPKLVNISTRARVLTGDAVMIGGFYIAGGTGSKTVLLRARGPSLGAPPFNNPGVLANPTFQLFSGSTVIAQNNDWQSTDSLCVSPAVSCGGVTEITATGLDPCQPNPGETVPPPNCDQESAIYVTLPPGGYTAIVRGVAGGIGMGLVEIFEISP